jgi:hypothetical protein
MTTYSPVAKCNKCNKEIMFPIKLANPKQLKGSGNLQTTCPCGNTVTANVSQLKFIKV